MSPTGLPSVEWVSLLAQYLQHDCDCVVRQQAKLRKDSFRYHVQLDVEHGHSKAGFRALRADAKPPFTEVPHAVRAQVHLLDGSLPHEYWVDPAPCRPFHVPGTASVDGVPCSLLAIEDGRLRLSGTGLPLQGVLQQDIVACTAEELHDAFEGFWGPILQRDLGAASQSLAEWPDVLRLLLRKAPTDQLPLRSFAPDLWNEAIRRMKSATSTGVCGWNCTDLKLLPEEAVAILAHIFHQAVTCQLPAHLMRARVCVYWPRLLRLKAWARAAPLPCSPRSTVFGAPFWRDKFCQHGLAPSRWESPALCRASPVGMSVIGCNTELSCLCSAAPASMAALWT